MGTNRISTLFAGQAVVSSLLACLTAGAILFAATTAVAQQGANAQPPPPAEHRGFLAAVGHWFDQQTKNFRSNLKDTGSKFQNFGYEAGIAAKTTVEGAKNAAGAVARIPTARMVTGHEKCALAPNGAPDCVAAASALCKAKGFASGKSVDMTTAEVCPAQVYLSGRNSGPGCHTETFVSRVFCQ